ncbi:hypothetical protein [Ferruginibacter sp. SUN106]|uniref:hypothetical protein n=1 Tax=Ferruginibacter sp. SUN106 TaxID=2978348 RepID=UPI003D3646A3
MATLQSTISNLLNRQFKIADIKQHLLNNGYTFEEIESAINAAVAARNNSNKKTISSKQASRSIAYVLIGVVILSSFLGFRNSGTSPGFNIGRALVGTLMLLYGFYLANRPLKD